MTKACFSSLCTCYLRTQFLLSFYHVPGVLHADCDMGKSAVEAHLCPELEGADGRTRSRRLRIAHIVIRINTSHHVRTKGGSASPDQIASIEKHLLVLSHLQSVTLETNGEAEKTTKLAERLCVSSERGILYRRTCKESWDMALEAVKNPTFRAEQQNIVSPMWCSDRFDDVHCREWCVIVSRPSMIPRSKIENRSCSRAG